MGYLIRHPSIPAGDTAVATSKAEFKRFNSQFSTVDGVRRVAAGDAVAVEKPMSDLSFAHGAPQRIRITGFQFLIFHGMHCEVD